MSVAFKMFLNMYLYEPYIQGMYEFLNLLRSGASECIFTVSVYKHLLPIGFGLCLQIETFSGILVQYTKHVAKREKEK